MTSEKAEILPNIECSEYENGGIKTPEDKARNRMVAEGYKYQALNGDRSEHQLGEGFYPSVMSGFSCMFRLDEPTLIFGDLRSTVPYLFY